MGYCYRKNAVKSCTIIKNINIDYILIELFANNSNDNNGDVDVKRVHSNMSVKRRGLQINSFEICIEITNKQQTHTLRDSRQLFEMFDIYKSKPLNFN